MTIRDSRQKLHLGAWLSLVVLFLTVSAAGQAQDPKATTLWWVVFNNPDRCATSPCSGADLRNPEVQATVFYSTGHTTRPDGSVMLVGSVYQTQKPFAGSVETAPIPGNGLKDFEKAEIHLVVRTHGPVIPQYVDQQVLL